VPRIFEEILVFINWSAAYRSSELRKAPSFARSRSFRIESELTRNVRTGPGVLSGELSRRKRRCVCEPARDNANGDVLLGCGGRKPINLKKESGADDLNLPCANGEGDAFLRPLRRWSRLGRQQANRLRD